MIDPQDYVKGSNVILYRPPEDRWVTLWCVAGSRSLWPTLNSASKQNRQGLCSIRRDSLARSRKQTNSSSFFRVKRDSASSWPEPSHMHAGFLALVETIEFNLKVGNLELPSLYRWGTVACLKSAAMSGFHRSRWRMNIAKPKTSLLLSSEMSSPKIVWQWAGWEKSQKNWQEWEKK